MPHDRPQDSPLPAATMRFRKLRIALSATCVLACALLVVLWVRSWDVQSSSANWYGDAWMRKVPGKRFYKVFSNRGRVRLMTSSTVGNWTMEVLEDDRSAVGFGVLQGQTSYYAQIPHWFLDSLAAFGVVTPWIPWSRRFSLRTLLIVTTLAAMALGVIVYATRE